MMQGLNAARNFKHGQTCAHSTTNELAVRCSGHSVIATEATFGIVFLIVKVLEMQWKDKLKMHYIHI